ncbi:transporter [Geminocystis sp. NIES-3708]|nr:transporter [Geminocystis sp. NIES-3708]
MQRIKQDLKNDLIAGLLVVIPLATTIWLSYVIANWAIKFLTEIPKQINPFDGLNPIVTNLLNFFVGLTVPLALILLIGLMARNIVGRWLLDVGEKILQGIPLAGSIYKTLKQILETLFQDSETKFRRVVMVEYPRKGVWSVGFVTGKVSDMIQSQFDKPVLSIFIPTTPNPTSGWYAVIPAEEVITLSLSIEDAFKVLISGGIVSPNSGEMVHNNNNKTSISATSLTNDLSSTTTSEIS